MASASVRAFADPYENAVVVEYFTETVNPKNGRVESERKVIKVRLGEFGYDADDRKLVKRVLKKANIPELRSADVQDAVIQLRQRHGHESDAEEQKGKGAGEGSVLMDGIAAVDRCVDLLYGSIEDKLRGTEFVISLCREDANLQVLAQNNQLVAALARTLSDDSKGSIHVCFNAAKIFLALSNFSDVHHILARHRIGALIMDAIDLEIKRARHRAATKGDSNEQDGEETEIAACPLTRKQEHVVYICLCVLDRVGDDIEVRRKMLRKGLLHQLNDCLDCQMKDCVLIALTLLRKVSMFEEIVIELAEAEANGICKLVRLANSTDHQVVDQVLRVLFNLSFNRDCRNHMEKQSIFPILFALLKKPKPRAVALRLLYHLSVDECSRRHLACNECISTIMQLVLNFPREFVAKELAAVAINASLEPRCAENMVQYIPNLLSRVQKIKDVLLARILRNFSIWTRRLQGEIAAAVGPNGTGDLGRIVNDPSKFINATPERDGSMVVAAGHSSTYRDSQFWEEHISVILSMCVNCEENDMIVELMGTLSNMTVHDLPLHQTWSDLISTFSLTAFLSKHLAPEIDQNDVKLEAIILCGNACAGEKEAVLFANSDVPSAMNKIFIETNDDEVALQILCAYHHFLPHGDSRAAILSKGITERIFEYSSSRCRQVRQSAERCLDLIQELDRGQNGLLGDHAQRVREQRFLAFHADLVHC